jgi:2,3-bisphosphoglycerate-dependent phosphoglycerate mutase
MTDTNSYHITFLRHGESVGNAEDRFQGHADFPLTRKGRAQARALAERWQAEAMTFDQCIASPLLRACQTAEIISKVLKIPLELDPDWMEINNGLLAGLTPEEAAQVSPRPGFITPYTRYGETGESRWEVYLRAGRAIQHILDRRPGGCSRWDPEHGFICHPGYPGTGQFQRAALPVSQHHLCDVYV